MDALMFQNELSRMCKTFSECLDGCPAYKYCFLHLSEGDNESHRKLIEIVEQWSKEHPEQTNRQKFKEVFGFDTTNNAMKQVVKSDNGNLFYTFPKSDWWDMPYEAPKAD